MFAMNLFLCMWWGLFLGVTLNDFLDGLNLFFVLKGSLLSDFEPFPTATFGGLLLFGSHYFWITDISTIHGPFKVIKS